MWPYAWPLPSLYTPAPGGSQALTRLFLNNAGDWNKGKDGNGKQIDQWWTENECYRLKATVRMIRKTRRLPHAELIQQEKRIQVS